MIEQSNVAPGLARRDLRVRPAKPELIAHLHHFAVAAMDFDELRAADRLAVLVFERGDDLPRPRVDHVGRVAPGETAVETERHPAVTALSQFYVAGLLRRHLRGVEAEEFFAFLIADPEFRFVGRERGAVRAMENRLITGEDTAQHFAVSQVHDIEPDVFAEADVSETVPAINGEREHAAFANLVDVANQ